jgi:hypothetical protein
VMYASFFLQLLQFETFALGAPSEPISRGSVKAPSLRDLESKIGVCTSLQRGSVSAGGRFGESRAVEDEPGKLIHEACASQEQINIPRTFMFRHDAGPLGTPPRQDHLG